LGHSALHAGKNGGGHVVQKQGTRERQERGGKCGRSHGERVIESSRNARSLNRPHRSRRRKREWALASAPAWRSLATSNAMVRRRSSAESKASCAPQSS